ncbi:MAG: hypothetical protein R2844_11910 [Caldilineales bacterium]
MTWPLARQRGSAIPGDGFDGWQNLWNLWWMREAWLVRHISPYFTDILFAPTGADLRFQTMAPFNGFMFMNVQTAFGLIPAFNGAVLFSFVVGGYGAFLLAVYALRRRAGRRTVLAAGFIAGIIFAFSPYHFAHTLGHLQLIALQWIPFYVLYLVRGLDRAARPPSPTAWLADAAKAGLFLALVGLCDWYYVMYCLFFTALALLVWLARRRLTWRGLAMVAGAGGLFVLALSPLLVPMVQGARTWGGASLVRDYTETLALSADLLAFVTPQVFHPLWGMAALARAASFTATPSEYTVFAGFTVLILAGIALVATRTQRGGAAVQTDSPAARPGFYLVSAAFFALLALGPVLKVNGRTDLLPGGGEIPLPYRLLYETVPFIKLSRSVSRMDVMVMLFLGVAAAFALLWVVDRLQAGRQPGTRRAIAVLTPLITGVLIVFEFLPAPFPVSQPDTPAWYATLAQNPDQGAVYNLPANFERPGYLLYQITHGKPLTTAYVTRDDPRTLRERAPVLSQFWFLGEDINTRQFDLSRQGIQVLHDLLGVRWVVLDRYKMPGGPEREITEAMAGEIFGDQQPLYSDDRITVYEVGEPPERAPYIVLGTGWQPRQVDETGPVWRTLPAGSTTSFSVVAPGDGPLALRIEAAAETGGSLRLLGATGNELAAWPLAAGVQAFVFDGAAPDSLTLLYDGPENAEAQIHSLSAVRK